MEGNSHTPIELIASASTQGSSKHCYPHHLAKSLHTKNIDADKDSDKKLDF